MSDDKASDNLSILVGIVLLAALGWGLVSLWGARHAVWQRVKETNMRPLAIATQPEGAAVYPSDVRLTRISTPRRQP